MRVNASRGNAGAGAAGGANAAGGAAPAGKAGGLMGPGGLGREAAKTGGLGLLGGGASSLGGHAVDKMLSGGQSGGAPPPSLSKARAVSKPLVVPRIRKPLPSRPSSDAC
jgi:hypothetical protein